MTQSIANFIEKENYKLAYQKRDGKTPTLVWLCGFNSDMRGSKAEAMDEIAQNHGISSLRFDYSGTGESSGDFSLGTISKWTDDAQYMIDNLTKGPLILVGSSMGGWISLKLALANKLRIKAMALCAPAPDFTDDLMWSKFDDKIKSEILNNGFWLRPTEYDENPYKITRELIEDGRKNLLLDAPIELDIPIEIIHGMNDEDVPWQRSPKLMTALTSNNVNLHLIKNGNHRLSEPQDLELLKDRLNYLLKTIL